MSAKEGSRGEKSAKEVWQEILDADAASVGGIVVDSRVLRFLAAEFDELASKLAARAAVSEEMAFLMGNRIAELEFVLSKAVMALQEAEADCEARCPTCDAPIEPEPGVGYVIHHAPGCALKGAERHGRAVLRSAK